MLKELSVKVYTCPYVYIGVPVYQGLQLEVVEL